MGKSSSRCCTCTHFSKLTFKFGSLIKLGSKQTHTDAYTWCHSHTVKCKQLLFVWISRHLSILHSQSSTQDVLLFLQDPSMIVTPATSFDMDKVRTTIKQFFRDWSEEGATERNLCYKPIIDEIVRRYPPDNM